MSETVATPEPVADVAAEPAAIVKAEADIAVAEAELAAAKAEEAAPIPATPTTVTVRNALGRAVFLDAPGVPPERLVLGAGASAVVPAAFWAAWQSRNAGADFAAHITGD